jgi:hypothetical protein
MEIVPVLSGTLLPLDAKTFKLAEPTVSGIESNTFAVRSLDVMLR